jgi:hypothetical protein
MSSNSDNFNEIAGEIKRISKELRELVYSAPSQWLWDSVGSAVSTEQIGDTIDRIESNVKKTQQYCSQEYKEVTNSLLDMMWFGLRTKNYEAVLQAAQQLNNIKINFESEPFGLKLD